MKIFRPITIVFLLIMSMSNLSAQEEMKSRFHETNHPKYPEAKAAYLINDCKVKYEVPRNGAPTLYLYHHERIKIYDESALDLGNFELYASASNDEKEYIYDIEAVVYNQNGSEISESKLKKENIYKNKESKYYTSVKFALPDVRVGSIIDIKYTKSSPFIYTIPRHYFQHDIPVESSELVVNLPNKMSFNPIAKGELVWTQTQEVDNFASPPVTRFTLSAKDLRPIEEDEYVLNINDYRSSIKYELSTYYYNNGRVANFSKSWDDIARDLTNNEQFGKQLRNKLKPLKSIVKEIKAMNQEDRIQFVYDYVRENYAWNGNYGKLADRKIKKMLDEKTGNIADLNLLLVNLLRKAGFDAYPMILKSRWNGILDSQYPSVTDPNYVVAYIEVDDEKIVLDATSKLVPMGELPLRAINSLGIMIKSEEGIPYEMNNPNRYKSDGILALEIDLENKSLIGINEGKYTNYAATQSRIKKDKNIVDEDAQSNNENDLDLYEMISVENLDDIYKPIKYKRNEVINSSIEAIDGKLFIKSFVKDEFERNPFTEYKRKHPVFFNSSFDIRHTSKLKIPDGYKVETIPETLAVKLPENGGLFIYEAKEIGDELFVTYNIKLSKLIFTPYEYPQLREFFKKLIDKQSEKIILSEI